MKQVASQLILLAYVPILHLLNRMPPNINQRNLLSQVRHSTVSTAPLPEKHKRDEDSWIIKFWKWSFLIKVFTVQFCSALPLLLNGMTRPSPLAGLKVSIHVQVRYETKTTLAFLFWLSGSSYFDLKLELRTVKWGNSVCPDWKPTWQKPRSIQEWKHSYVVKLAICYASGYVYLCVKLVKLSPRYLLFRNNAFQTSLSFRAPWQMVLQCTWKYVMNLRIQWSCGSPTPWLKTLCWEMAMSLSFPLSLALLEDQLRAIKWRDNRKHFPSTSDISITTRVRLGQERGCSLPEHAYDVANNEGFLLLKCDPVQPAIAPLFTKPGKHIIDSLFAFDQRTPEEKLCGGRALFLETGEVAVVQLDEVIFEHGSDSFRGADAHWRHTFFEVGVGRESQLPISRCDCKIEEEKYGHKFHVLDSHWEARFREVGGPWQIKSTVLLVGW